MRIGHVCPFVGEQMGGSERYVYNLSRQQAKSHEAHVFTTTVHPEKVGTCVEEGVIVHRYYAPVTVWNINPLCVVLRPLVKTQVDVYHIHSYLYTLANQAAVARRVTDRRALLQAHGGLGLPPYRTHWTKVVTKHAYDLTLGRMTMRWSDLIASVSHADLRTIQRQFRVPHERLRYIPNVVDTNRFRPGTEKRDGPGGVLIYVGDLEPWKGVGTLMEWVWQAARDNGHKMTVRFVGQGSLYEHLLSLKERLKRMGSRVSVEVLGQRGHEEIPRLMRGADALVLPSYWEGTPTVVLEAMASGTVVMCTPVGDIPEVVTDRVNGLIIGRDFRSFSGAVDIVMDQYDMVKTMTRNARRLVEERFSLEKVNSTIEQVYRELVEGRA